MCEILDAPEIRRAEATGYGFEYVDDEPVYLTQDGAMYEDEFIEYMQDYCRTNPREMAAIFGVEVIR